MAGNTQTDPRYTLNEYLAFEETSEIKHEFIDGRVYAMAGGTFDHNLISNSLAVTVGRQLRAGCRGLSSDQKIYIESADEVTYADLSIVCGDPSFAGNTTVLLTNPRVIFEVLSPSTEKWDRNGKWTLYQMIPSLTDYVLVSQDTAQIDHYTRADGGRWLYQRVAGINGELTISSIGCTLPLVEIYDGIELQAEPARPPIQIV